MDWQATVTFLHVFRSGSTFVLLHCTCLTDAIVEQMSDPRPKLTRRRGACEECRLKKVRCMVTP